MAVGLTWPDHFAIWSSILFASGAGLVYLSLQFATLWCFVPQVINWEILFKSWSLGDFWYVALVHDMAHP